MIQFTELRITPDNKNLIIEVQISKDPKYASVKIKNISIDTQETYTDGGISRTPIFTRDYENTTSVNLSLSKDDLKKDLINNMFYIYVTTEGAVSSSSVDSNIAMRTVVNLLKLYEKAMKHIKEIDCNCEIPKDLLDIILRIKALDICIRTGNYNQANNYWNKYFINKL